MKTNITDIFMINSITNNVMECKNINLSNISNKSNKFKKISETKYKIYVKNNMELLVDSKGNKYCELVEYNNNQLINNKLIVNSTIKAIPLCSFPFIDEYDDIIQRYTTTYSNNIQNNIQNSSCNDIQNNLHIIKETNSKSNETITFVRLDNFNTSNLENILEIIV